ncbi:hypothetical protein MIR68_011129 [Amoeboaphelidium protococcarum]|nr:hypothetical protein MIR68_011129 [Amoeboaphelidium protococcarum]
MVIRTIELKYSLANNIQCRIIPHINKIVCCDLSRVVSFHDLDIIESDVTVQLEFPFPVKQACVWIPPSLAVNGSRITFDPYHLPKLLALSANDMLHVYDFDVQSCMVDVCSPVNQINVMSDNPLNFWKDVKCNPFSNSLQVMLIGSCHSEMYLILLKKSEMSMDSSYPNIAQNSLLFRFRHPDLQVDDGSAYEQQTIDQVQFYGKHELVWTSVVSVGAWRIEDAVKTPQQSPQKKRGSVESFLVEVPPVIINQYCDCTLNLQNSTQLTCFNETSMCLSVFLLQRDSSQCLEFDLSFQRQWTQKRSIVTHVKVAHDGQVLVGSVDGMLRVYGGDWLFAESSSTLQPQCEFKVSEHPITSIISVKQRIKQFNVDQFLVLGTKSGQCVVTSYPPDKVLHTFNVCSQSIAAVTNVYVPESYVINPQNIAENIKSSTKSSIQNNHFIRQFLKSCVAISESNVLYILDVNHSRVLLNVPLSHVDSQDFVISDIKFVLFEGHQDPHRDCLMMIIYTDIWNKEYSDFWYIAANQIIHLRELPPYVASSQSLTVFSHLSSNLQKNVKLQSGNNLCIDASFQSGQLSISLNLRRTQSSGQVNDYEAKCITELVKQIHILGIDKDLDRILRDQMDLSESSDAQCIMLQTVDNQYPIVHLNSLTPSTRIAICMALLKLLSTSSRSQNMSSFLQTFAQSQPDLDMLSNYILQEGRLPDQQPSIVITDLIRR